MNCPRCNSANVSRWDWRHPLILHWILNPGLAFNEVFLGQRIPAVTFLCKDCRCGIPDRNWMHCDYCDSDSMGRLWMGSYSFGHWFGIFCPHCGTKVPTLWNLTSLILLALLCPIWIPLRFLFREKFIHWEHIRGKRALEHYNEHLTRRCS